MLAVSRDVAVQTGLTYKSVTTDRDLLDLNGGKHGLTQIGKDVVFYPHRDAAAIVKLVRLLDSELSGVRGPSISGEYRMRDVSAPVYLRYGAFDEQWGTKPEGSVFAAVLDPKGTAVPDERGRPAPAWAAEPKLTDLLVRDSAIGQMLAKRFLIIESMPFVGKSDLFLAIDSHDGVMCVAKRSRRFHFEDEWGGDAYHDLVAETKMLRKIDDLSFVPTLRESFQDVDEAWLVMDAVSGTRLDRWVQHPSRTDLERRVVGDRMEVAFEQLHARDIVHGDVSTANVLVDDELQPWLIDFATALGSGQRRLRDFATPGYFLDAQRSNTAQLADDRYGLGAARWAIETGFEPSHLPQSFVTSTSWRLLGREESDVTALIDEQLGGARRSEPAGSRTMSVKRVVRGLHLATANHVADAWRRGELVPVQHFTLEGYRSASLDSGNAGMLLALSDSAGANLDIQLLVDGARTLVDAPQDPSFPGLIHGAAGTLLITLGIGVRSGDEVLRERSTAKLLHSLSTRAAGGQLDLYSGTAGQLRAACTAFAITQDREFLGIADRLAAELLAAATPSGLWEVTAGNTTPRRWMLGYAHGAAGMGDALLDHWEITNSPETLRSVELIVAQLSEAFDELSGMTDGHGHGANESERSELRASSWCNGWAGVAVFLSRVSRRTPVDVDLEIGGFQASYRSLADRLPVFCHGAASALNGLLALEAAGVSVGPQLHDATDLLVSRAIWADQGATFASDDGGPTFPGLLTGYGGIPVVLQRWIGERVEPISVAHLASVANGATANTW